MHARFIVDAARPLCPRGRWVFRKWVHFFSFGSLLKRCAPEGNPCILDERALGREILGPETVRKQVPRSTSVQTRMHTPHLLSQHTNAMW